MFIFEVLNGINYQDLFSSACGLLGAPCPCNSTSIIFQGHSYCPGSTFTPIAAAYQTQGMWVQADLIRQIMTTRLGQLATLLYLCSAIGALIGLALGAPPKMYLWFLLGPPIFHFLLGTPYAVKGTEWQVAAKYQDQRKVWELSEVGLLNSNWVSKARMVYSDGAPASSVDVSLFFAEYDAVVSSTIQHLISWTGLYNLRGSTQGVRSSIGPAPTSSRNPLGGLTSTGKDQLGDRWWLLSDTKWGIIENITSAKLANPKIRDALSTFSASECGDILWKEGNPSAYISAMYGSGKLAQGSQTAPDSIFFRENDNTSLRDEQYEKLFRKLYGSRVPFPRSLREVFRDNPDNMSSFVASLGMADSVPGVSGLSGSANEEFRQRILQMQYIRCPAYLHILLEAFRWEAGQIYYQIQHSAPLGLNTDWLVYYLTYGWNLKKADGSHLDQNGNVGERDEFLKNLILVHLIRNEMMLQPSNFTNRKSAFDTTNESATGHLRFVATKNKFSEMYQWALMVPHMQGILLYYLAVAFPFCAMMMVVPGFHKVLFTWMTFWLWAKLWDLGFAIVTALERSVWAMIGSNSQIKHSFAKIIEMADWGHIGVEGCSGAHCEVPCTSFDWNQCRYAHISLYSGGTNSFSVTDLTQYSSWAASLRIFDRAMSVASSLDLDLSNSYYIYIMAGLYLSVPVVVGQLVLGAKAGSANLISNVIGAVGTEAGRQAASGFQSDMIYRMKANKAAIGQEAYAKGHRASGLMDAALGYANQGILNGIDNKALGTAASAIKLGAENAQLSRQLAGAKQDVAKSMVGFLGNAADTAGEMAYRGAGAAGAGRPGTAGGPAALAGTSGSGGDGKDKDGKSDQGNPSTLAQVGQQQGDATGRSFGDRLRAAGAFTGRNADLIGDSLHLGASGLNVAADAGMLQGIQYAVGTQANSNAIGADSAIRGFGYETQSTLLGASNERVQAQADFDARMASWDAENAYSNQFASLSSALGFFAGGLEAGNKPTEKMGMAMNGNLGDEAAARARATEPNSWLWGHGLELRDGINSHFGSKHVAAEYDEKGGTWGVWGYNVGRSAGIMMGSDVQSQTMVSPEQSAAGSLPAKASVKKEDFDKLVPEQR